MKISNRYISPLILLIIFTCCDDEISPDLRDAPPVMVVDAWINNKPEDQLISLTWSREYFDDQQPTGISGAVVSISDDLGKTYSFNDVGDGKYKWFPPANEVFGEIGRTYFLSVVYDGSSYTAISSMNRAPLIDSVTFRFEKKDFVFPDSYWAEFWSRDLEGPGDTYWIKSFKNGEYLSKPIEINIAFDAGFSSGGNIDGLIFIPPIRDAINPLDEDGNNEFLSPFSDGDSVYVEVHSIPNDAFIFLNEMALQIDRPGGFGELFATPLSNVPTNITGSQQDPNVIGFFVVSAVNGKGKKLDINEIPRLN